MLLTLHISHFTSHLSPITLHLSLLTRLMECPRCRSKIPQGSVNYPECGKPLATFPINEIQKQQAGFNPMWFIYGGCGCVFLIGVLILLLLILGILIVPPL